VSDFSIKIEGAANKDGDPDVVDSVQPGVWVEEYSDMRMLSFGDSQLQSGMKIGSPDVLAISYTQRIMAFLLFHSKPQHIVMIGLGGGSLAKFIYHQMPNTSIVVVEVNPQVLDAAHAHFYLPQDDERLHVVIDEGSRYIANHESCADILIVDGFDLKGQAPLLCTQSFYNDCLAAIKPGGVLVVNLFGLAEEVKIFLKRIQTSFGGAVFLLPSSEDENLVVFGFKDASTLIVRNTELLDRADVLKDRYGLLFPRFVQTIKPVSSKD